LSDHYPSGFGPHDWSHGAPHNSWAPLILSAGFCVFLFSFAKLFVFGDIAATDDITSALAGVVLGLVIISTGLYVWWQQDMSFDGTYEPKARGAPFQNIDIRKVAMWIFLMSEMMIFSSLFSTYIRYRTALPNCLNLYNELNAAGNLVSSQTYTCYEPASQLIAASWWHLAPGAINTFALILSSFTVVQALRYAKMADLDEEVRRKKVYRYLGCTMMLAMLFLSLKMIEWFIGFNIFGHEIPSLVSEGYSIHASAYQPHWAHGGHFTTNIRISATMFYVTTGTHGVHVLAGVIGLAYLTLKAFRGGFTPENAVTIEYFGLYWHFVDLVWVLVFPFFYLF